MNLNRAGIIDFSKRGLLLFASFVLLFGPTNYAFAEVEDFIDKFAANNIMFYNPEDCVTTTTGSSSQTTLSGSNVAEKIWNYLINFGFNDAQAAGILGNIQAESSMIVSEESSAPYGLVQWLGGRKNTIKERISSAGLGQYLGSPYSRSNDGIPDDALNKLITVQLDFIIEENSNGGANGWIEEVKKADTPELAAETFLVLFERAVGGNSPIQYYTPKKGQNYQATAKRRDYAVQFYNQYSGRSATSGASGSENSSGMASFASLEECCDPQGSDYYSSQQYELSDAQLNGLMAIVKNENGGTLDAVKTQASIMANIYESKRPGEAHNADNFVNYIRTGGWFANANNVYNESFTNYTQSELEAVKDIWINGNRSIPNEIVEHDSLSLDIDYIELNGRRIGRNEAGFKDKKNYVPGKTIIHQDPKRISGGSQWIFYTWANPNGNTVSDSSSATTTGDPFGYMEDNPPEGNASKSTSFDGCCVKEGAKNTKATIDDVTYAWPIADATQANTINYSATGGTGIDVGANTKMISGSQARKYGGSSDDKKYDSAGATVVAIASGKIDYVKTYNKNVPAEWQDKCGQLSIIGNDGNTYWVSYLDYSSITVKAGDTVTAGDKIGSVGAPQCTPTNESHIHIDNASGTNAKPKEWTAELAQKLAQNLPESNEGSGVDNCVGVMAIGDLPATGMTEQEAKAYMDAFRALALSERSNHPGKGYTMTAASGKQYTISYQSGCGSALKNCVGFTKWFLAKYDKNFNIASTGNGGQVVSTLAKHGYATGREPRLYAVFSVSGGSWGHTGIILGRTNDGKWITGEANCSTGGWGEGAIGIRIKTTAQMSNYTFAYPEY